MNGWGVLLATATGEGAASTLEVERRRLAGLLGRSDVWVRTSERGASVVLGAHEAVDSAGAQRDLAFAKEFEVDGVRPFARAFLVPPMREARELEGSDTALNLGRVRGERGRSAAYTLQVGVFEGVPDQRRAMEAAEGYARELRGAGHEAFYYHGPNRSMVTVGVFGRSDWDPMLMAASAGVRSLQREFPMIRVESYRGRGRPEVTEVPSQLVLIPES